MFYFSENETEKPMVYPGCLVEARVIAVAPKAVRLEVFGIECSVRACDMALTGIMPKTLQRYLGHATLQMTMDLYVHVTDGFKQEEIKKLEKVMPKNYIFSHKHGKIHNMYACVLQNAERKIAKMLKTLIDWYFWYVAEDGHKRQIR